MKIITFIPEYAWAVSHIINENLYKVNIKDYSAKDIDDMAKKHTPDDILAYASSRHMLVAIIDDLPVATVSVYKDEEMQEQFILSTYFVTPTMHNRGIGKCLLEEVEKYLKEQSAKSLKVFASLSAVDFYKLMGFDFILEEKLSPDGQNYPMIKNINKNVVSI